MRRGWGAILLGLALADGAAIAAQLPARVDPAAARAEAGRKIYAREKCATCHQIARRGNSRFPLDGVGSRLKADQIRRWITETAAMEDALPRMPAVRMSATQYRLNAADLEALVAYLLTLKQGPRGPTGQRTERPVPRLRTSRFEVVESLLPMPFWFPRSTAPARPGGLLGPLEWRVLEALWARAAPSAVRDLTAVFPDTAYTTLMTTLDRLHRKGVLSRQKVGRAFLYQPGMGRTEFESARAADAFRRAIERTDGSLAPLVSCLIDAVGDRDRELLDELESLVAARRSDVKGKRS